MSTTLVVNPRDDTPFVAMAERLVADGVRSPGELQDRLRREYPDAVVRARELDGEAFTIWYVYRDGHWVSGAGGDRREADVSELENDLRATGEASPPMPPGWPRSRMRRPASRPTIRGWSSSAPRARRSPVAWSPRRLPKASWPPRRSRPTVGPPEFPAQTDVVDDHQTTDRAAPRRSGRTRRLGIRTSLDPSGTN